MKIKLLVGVFLWIVCLSLISCTKDFLPKDRESLATDMIFTNPIFQPTLGRNYAMNGNFSVGNSSQPINLKILNVLAYDGSPAPELNKTYPVMVWKEPYTGTEKSIEEIQAKQTTENRPLFEVEPHVGNFKMWGVANSLFVKTLPDSCYTFDVEVTNDGGGRVYFRKLQLMPYRERPFEPSNQDRVSGLVSVPYITPTIFSNIYGDSTGKLMSLGDVHIYFDRMGDGNSLTFKFLDNRFNSISVDSFPMTNWSNLVHGFNMRKTRDSVTYDIAYPIPLVTRKTNYTNYSGTRAHIEFSYSRLGFADMTTVGTFGLDFAIFQPGAWRIIFQFSKENPKFRND